MLQRQPERWRGRRRRLCGIPTAAWNIVDAANSTTLSSPVGDAAVGIAFAADPFFFFNSVDEVANYFFSTGGSITNVSIVSASAPYSFAGGTQRDFEFDAVNQSELAGPGTPVHGWFTALLVPGQYFLTWLEIAHRNVAGAYCGTLFALRTLLKRL